MVWSAASQYKKARAGLTAHAMAMSLTAHATAMSHTAIRVSATSVRKSHVNLTHYKPRSVSRAADKLEEGNVVVMGIAMAMAIHRPVGRRPFWGGLRYGAAPPPRLKFHFDKRFCVAAG